MHKITDSCNFSVPGEEKTDPENNKSAAAFTELERGVYAALETYSNVHRGSGHYSMASTYLFEQARNIVLEYLNLDKRKYVVIFCTPGRAEALNAQLEPESYHCLSSQDIGLSLGIRALAVHRKALPKHVPLQTGGGTARLVSPSVVVWAGTPDKFEAGTPAIVNIIAFVKALFLIRHFGNKAFRDATAEKTTASEILYHDELEGYTGKKLLDELRKTLIGKNVLVPTAEGAKPYVNLDNAASTPAFTPIWKTFCQAWRQPTQIQQEIVHEVRTICAGILGAPLESYDVIFTSNTTEAINLTAKSMSNESDQDSETVVINTLLEHNSNELPWRYTPRLSLIRLQIDREGFVNLNELETLLSEYNQKGLHGNKRIKLVAVSGASNVLGVYNNLAEISRIVHQYGARLLVDAAQMVAHRKVEMERYGIDYLAFSAHKVYAPFGSGALVVRKGLLKFSPAEMELIRLSGEENAAGIAALGKALVLLQRIGLDLIQEEEQALTGRTLHGLAQIKGITIYGIKEPDSPQFIQRGGVIVFSLKGLMPDVIAKELAVRAGIGVRYGCHCAHLLIKHLLKINSFLEQLQGVILRLFYKLTLPGLVRVSLGIENSEEDVDIFIRVLGEIARQPRKSPATMHNGTPVSQQMKDFTRLIYQKVYSRP